MWTTLDYAWRIAVNVIYVVVVLTVFSELRGHTENVIVPILGMLYVTIRSVAMGQTHMFITFGESLDGIEERIKSIADASYVRNREDAEEIRKQVKTVRAKLIIEAVALGVIGIACVWKFFAEL